MVFSANDEQYRRIDLALKRIRCQFSQSSIRSPLDPEYVAKILEALLEEKEVIVVDETSVIAPDNIVVVPNLSAAGLVARAKQDLALTYLDDDFAKWNFVNGEEGKRYERLIWTPGRVVQSADIRTYFRERGFNGNTAAFVAWAASKNPEGYFVSIPDEDDRLWPDPESGRLYAPRFIRIATHRKLRLFDVGGWHGPWSFVAFREVSP